MTAVGWESWSDMGDGLRAFFWLLASAETWSVVRQSLIISLSATALAVLVGLPAGTLLAVQRFRGRRLVLTACNTGFGLPPVVVGLLLSILLLRHGPLGWLELRFTPTGLILAQFILSCPIVMGLTAAAIQQLNPKLRLQIKALGASHGQMLWLLCREARLPLAAAYMAAFGSVVSEVGASLLVGGNLPGSTRVLTTAIVMEASQGNYDKALAYGLILLLLVLTIVGLLTWLQQRDEQGTLTSHG
jgi:tungstate transport system permease protein